MGKEFVANTECQIIINYLIPPSAKLPMTSACGAIDLTDAATELIIRSTLSELNLDLARYFQSTRSRESPACTYCEVKEEAMHFFTLISAGKGVNRSPSIVA